MNDTMHVLGFADVRKYFHISDSADLADDFFIKTMSVDKNMSFFKYPCRFDGFVAVFCLKGHLMVDLNLKSFELKENTLMLYVPGNIVRVREMEGVTEPPMLVVVGASRELIADVRLDFAKLFNESMAILDNPCISLTQKEFEISKKYYELARDLMGADIPNLRETIRALFSSIFYLLGTLWNRKLNENVTNHVRVSSRSKMVFESFLKLVTEHHNEERNLSFYADKLFLTPKYLSKLIKTVSGQSAPDWIDYFVILEAKNMLKYSEMTIKEIAMRLNFSSVPVFHKFFKQHTGMTPRDWREEY